MTLEEYEQLNAKLSELKTAKEITAFMDDVARRFGDDDPLVAGLGEQAAMIKFAMKQRRGSNLDRFWTGSRLQVQLSRCLA